MDDERQDAPDEQQPAADQQVNLQGRPKRQESDDFKMTLDTFAGGLVGRMLPPPRGGKGKSVFVPASPELVYLKLLRLRHGREAHTAAEWRELVAKIGAEPAHPHGLGGR